MDSIPRQQDAGAADVRPPVDDGGTAVGRLLNVLRLAQEVILPVIFVPTTLHGLWMEPTFAAAATVMTESLESRAVDAWQVSPVAAGGTATLL